MSEHATDGRAYSGETKARLMRSALGKLAAEYISAGEVKKSAKLQRAAEELEAFPESLARLFDIIRAS